VHWRWHLLNNKIVNALTFDVEDWYMGIEIGSERWHEFEKRLHIGLTKILNILDEYNTKATFFVLGCCALECPDLIRTISDKGHEIATHGLSHTKIYDLTPEKFEDELANSITLLTQATGKTILGHRAPYFSITNDSIWSLDILKRNGIAYDCSIYPGANYRYGIDGTPDNPYSVEGSGIAEFPVSILRIGGKKAGLGGAYFRILPYSLTKAGILAYNKTGHPAIFYLHPWEFDPEHPKTDFPKKAQLTHYFNLKSTERKFRKLLRDFNFAPVSDVLKQQGLLQ
jgi:polysaccharide deacetylase family protein (PEP-CTERM system associated)